MARLAAVCVVSLLLAGCGRAHVATPDDCRRACEHVTELQLAPLKKQEFVGLHEMEESAETVEAQTEQNIKRIQEDLAGGNPQAARPPRDLSPAALREWREKALWLDDQLRQQRAQALVAARDNLANTKKQFAESKSASAQRLKKAFDEANSSCTSECVSNKRTAKDVQCLLRTQAVEDIQVCGSTGRKPG